MSKFSSSYVCQQCGYESVGFLGKCPNCGEWNSLVETVEAKPGKKSITSRTSITGIKIIKLSDIKASKTARILTKIPELDRVLGGGLVSGQVVLIAGEPGIGKSTLLLEVSDKLAAKMPSCEALAALILSSRSVRFNSLAMRSLSSS